MFKRIGLVFSLLLLSVVSIAAQNWGKGVTVYEDTNFRGRSQDFGVGRFLSSAGEFGNLKNDEASSVTVRRGFRVRFCENEGDQGRGSGKCETFRAGNFKLRYNDKASYIEVRRTNDGNWGDGNWGGGNGGNWNDSWAVGTWYWRRGNDRRTMTIYRDGRVTVFVNGTTTNGTYSNGRLSLDGSEATVTRSGNKIRVDITGSNESYIWTR